MLITHAPGIYRRPDGHIYRIRFSQDYRGIYSQHLVGEKWEYEPCAISTLDATMLLSLDDARLISRELGQCVACGRMLSDTASLAAGIGPSCAKAWTALPKRAFRVVTEAEIAKARKLQSRAYEAERSARAHASVRTRLEGERVTIRSQYDGQIIGIIKTFRGFTWDDRVQEWSLPREHALELAESFALAGIAHDNLAAIVMRWVA